MRWASPLSGTAVPYGVLLSPARKAGGAEDRLWNSGYRHRFGRLPWPRCRCRWWSGGGLLLQRLPEWAGGQRCAGVGRQTTTPPGVERAGGLAAADGTRNAQLAAGVEEGSRQDCEATADVGIWRSDGDVAVDDSGGSDTTGWIADELTGADGDVAACAALGISLDDAMIEHHQGRICQDIAAAARATGHRSRHFAIVQVEQPADCERY